MGVGELERLCISYEGNKEDSEPDVPFGQDLVISSIQRRGWENKTCFEFSSYVAGNVIKMLVGN